MRKHVLWHEEYSRWWMVVKLLIVMLYGYGAQSFDAQAAVVSTQVGLIEETDGIFKPVIGLSLDRGRQGGQLSLWGQRLAPAGITEMNMVAAMYYRFQPFRISALTSRIGGSLSYEYMSLDLNNRQSAESDLSLAMLFGFHLAVYQFSELEFGLFWDSYVIYLDLPLLLNGVLDRKTALGLSLSYEWDF